MVREKNSQLLTDAEVSVVRNAYNAFKFQAEREQKWKTDHNSYKSSFNMFNIFVVDLLKGIAIINQRWGDEVRATNFQKLENIFRCYVKTHPDYAEDALILHSTLTMLISKILERDDTIHTLIGMFGLYDEAMGDFDKKKQVFPDESGEN